MDTQIVTVVKRHWRRFLWIWIFPLVFLCTAFVPAFEQYPLAFFVALDLPLLFVCLFMASKPVRKHEVTLGQGMVLIVLVPFLIWASLIFGIFGIAIR